VLDWRSVSKLKSTYTDNLQTAINPDTGRVHTSYSIAGANTGRLASSDPNLQNIPVRTEEGGASARPSWRKGQCLVSLDYSRSSCGSSPTWRPARAQDRLPRGPGHPRHHASEMFGVPLDQMTPSCARAKAINFGIIYGISGFGLARNLRIPREQAQTFIDQYFVSSRHQGLHGQRDRGGQARRATCSTLFGRKIHTPEINASGPARPSPRGRRSTRPSRARPPTSSAAP
jgi:DNA polymerase-1